MAVGSALFAPSAWAQVQLPAEPPAPNNTPTQLCKLLSPDPNILGVNAVGAISSVVGSAPNRFSLQFLSPSQLTWRTFDNPGSDIYYVILRTTNNTRWAFNYLPNGSYNATAPIGPPSGNGTIVKTTLCYGETPKASTLVLPKCEDTAPVGVTCSAGFNGVALLSIPAQAAGQRIVETPCTCGDVVAKQCNADNLSAPDYCAKLIGPIKEVPDETVVVNGGANTTLYCTTKGSVRTCNFVTTGQQGGEALPKCGDLPGAPVTCAPGFNGAVLLSSKADPDSATINERLCTCGNVEGAQCDADTTGTGSCVALMGDTQEVPSQLIAVNGSYLYCRTSGGSRICTTITP